MQMAGIDYSLYTLEADGDDFVINYDGSEVSRMPAHEATPFKARYGEDPSKFTFESGTYEVTPPGGEPEERTEIVINYDGEKVGQIRGPRKDIWDNQFKRKTRQLVEGSFPPEYEEVWV